MKHKVLAILLCLAMVLSMTLPGTFAVSADEDSSKSQLTTDVCTCGAEDDIHAEDCPLYVQPEPSEQDPVCTCGSEDNTHAEDCPLYVAPETEQPGENPVCTCGAEDDNHVEDCPLYTQSEVAEEKPEGELPAWQEPYSPLAGVQPFLNVAPLMNMQSLMTLDDYERAGNDNGDVVLNKTAKANTNGSFTITLEAYATGASHTESHYDPADIVLVLDTSGSMKYPMTDDGYEAVYGKITNNNYGSTDRTDYTNRDDKGNTAKNAYSVTGHDSTVYNSNYYTYYIDVNGEKTQVWYYSGFGWATKANNFDGSNLNPNSTPYVPKTSADDWNSNHVQFYRIKEDSTRLKALQDAANTFISNVLTTSPESSIAIVNFGGSAATTQGFSSSTSTLQSAINGLTPSGATRADLGLSQANSLLENLDDTHKDHKKVVIMFTDGVPTSNSDFETDIANSAINNANSIKSGATVYTIGVFDGANGALSSFSSSDVNKYMHLVSSNYPNATSMTDTGDVNSELNGKSYYLSASNSTELMNIFQLISQEVGGATNTTLGTETVIKDIIAPSFTVPANTSDIKIYTADCIGAGLTFGTRTEVTSGITTTITGDTLDVKGFNFSANWCGDHSGTYGGKKLIIEFTVSPKTGFLGGNDVPTNGEASGMYSDENCIGSFDVPTVNVPIKEITITASDKNVYLLGGLTADQIKDGVTVDCGGVAIDLNQAEKNYGLKAWQTEYVDITVTCKDNKGNDVTDLNNLEGSKSYTVTVTVTPKTPEPESTEGTKAEIKSGNDTGWIYVFTPVLTFKDSQVWYGDDVPTDYTANQSDDAIWECGNKTSTDTGITMIGDAPTLDLTYKPDTSGVENGKIAIKTDISVDVTVCIGQTDVTENTDFVHTKCDANESAPANGKFWLHVKTCQLTITKTGGAANESYVFDVYKDGKKYTEVTIWGNGSETIYELPVGNYTIQEDTGWSWRYSANNGSAAALSAQTASGSITCNNTSNTDKWLNGFSTIVKNIFGVTDDKKSS